MRERELEIKAMEERLARRELHCPVCRAHVEDSYLVCPVCTTKLRQACVNCKAPLETLWQVCPYCETPVETPTTIEPSGAAAGAPERLAASLPLRGSGADTRAREAGRGSPRLTGEIVARFERRGLEIKAARLSPSTGRLAEEHYAEHTEKPFFGELVDFITSGPTMALVLEGEGAIATVRTTMGATNPADAAPGTIRGDSLDAGQPRPRLRLAGVRRARDRPVVPR